MSAYNDDHRYRGPESDDPGQETQAEMMRCLIAPMTYAAEVPAVRLTQHEWADIQSIVRDLLELDAGKDEVDLSGTLIQGQVLNEAVTRARRLRRVVEQS